MRKSRFREEQKVKMVREAEQRPIAEVAKKHGVSRHAGLWSSSRDPIVNPGGVQVCFFIATHHALAQNQFPYDGQSELRWDLISMAWAERRFTCRTE